MPLRGLVKLSVIFHQKKQKYLLQRSIPNALVLQSTFLTTESGHSLQDIALTCRQEGEKDFFNFLAKNTSKSVQEVIDYLWKIYGVAERDNSETISRIEKLVSTGNQETKNILPYAIGNSCKLRVKQRFVENCRKSFLLEPLGQIFNCFTKPAQGKYACTGLDEAEAASQQIFTSLRHIFSATNFRLPRHLG